ERPALALPGRQRDVRPRGQALLRPDPQARRPRQLLGRGRLRPGDRILRGSPGTLARVELGAGGGVLEGREGPDRHGEARPTPGRRPGDLRAARRGPRGSREAGTRNAQGRDRAARLPGRPGGQRRRAAADVPVQRRGELGYGTSHYYAIEYSGGGRDQ